MLGRTAACSLILTAALAFPGPARGESVPAAPVTPEPAAAPGVAPEGEVVPEPAPSTPATPPADVPVAPPAPTAPVVAPVTPAPLGPAPAAPAATPSFVSNLIPSSWASVGLFLGGAATAFVAHESCHIFVNYALGSSVHFEPVWYQGKIPFFSISPDVNCSGGSCTHSDGRPFGPGPAGMYAIVGAGVQCQQIANEIILSTEPDLFRHDAPFRKGVLAFNTLLSIGYAISNWAGQEPVAGDTATLERLTASHLPRGMIAAAIFIPAVIDIVRFFLPDQTWIPWVSRASKGLLVGFVFAI